MNVASDDVFGDRLTTGLGWAGRRLRGDIAIALGDGEYALGVSTATFWYQTTSQSAGKGGRPVGAGLRPVETQRASQARGCVDASLSRSSTRLSAIISR